MAMVTKQIKQAVAGALVCAMTLGIPGFPCYQALAQMSVARAGGAAAVPGGVGAAGAVSIPVSGVQPLAPSGLVPGMAAPVSLFAPSPSVIVPQASNGLAPVGPAAAAKIPSAMAKPLSVIPSRSVPTTWSTLQRIGGLAAKATVDDAASAEAGRGIGAAFDGSASAADDLFAAPVAAKQSSWSLLKAGTLSAAAAAVAMPLPALAAPAAQTVSAAPSLPMPMETGSIIVLGLAAVGLGIFLYNVNLAVTGWRDMRRGERRHKAFTHALSVRDRHAARLKQETGAVHVAALETSLNHWELLAYHNDPAKLAAQKAMPAIEGLPVRAELITPAAIKRFVMGTDRWAQPAPFRRQGARLRSPLVRALLIGAAAATPLMLLTAVATAAPLAAAVPLAMVGGGAAFSMLSFFIFFLISHGVFDRSLAEALLIGVIAGFGHPWIAFFVGLLLTHDHTEE